MADNTGAAFGVFPQMRPRRARQDREAAANAPLSALRGWAAGTAGLPGDIEGLLRMLVPGVSNEPALPTSEFYKEWLPGRSLNETPTGRAFTEAGSLAGGVGVGPLSRVAATGARAGGRLGAEALMRAMERGSPLTAMANPMYVIKPKGGNWLSGSVEGSLSGLKRDTGFHPGFDQDVVVLPDGSRVNNVTGEVLPPAQAVTPDTALNNWIDKQLTRYVKNEMATPEDPLRALAERGVLHYTPDELEYGVRPSVYDERIRQNLPIDEVATTDLGKNWEMASDQAIYPNKIEDLSTSREPWMNTALPGTTAYSAEYSKMPRLGFTHLIDELRNATNPASGLPPELLLKYSSLPQVSVPQAVERVANINAWRAAQKAEADLARANNAATVLHKEYPDKGFKWVELKQPEATVPEGAVWEEFGGNQRLFGPKGESLSIGATKDEAVRLLNRKEREAMLSDALKYEGGTMGHCVGGYCPDVLEGRSRIFSLRSAKGEPHVTVEVKPKEWFYEADKYPDPTGQYENFHKLIHATRTGNGDYETVARKLASEHGLTTPQNIKQIKGKANRAPNPEYLPYVQDFVKSGQWSDVGDLQNTGLRRFGDAFNENEIKRIQDAGIDIPTWASPDEIKAIGDKVWPGQYGTPPGFAQGGLVQKFGKGGVVKAALEEARDTVLKLKQLRDSGQLDWQSIAQDIPTRFYRGMSAMVRGGEDSPKYLEDLTEKYLGAQEPLSGVTSLAGQLRPPGILTDMPNMRKNMAWAASNPLTAASYASMPNSVMVPLELTQKPGVIFDAKGAPWQRFFSQTGRLPKSGKFTLDSNFKDALRDPEVKSILVKNIYDTGGIGSADELSDLYGLDILPKDLISSNLLIKDPSAVRYTLSGETPMLKEPKLKKAEGGLVQHTYDPAKIDALTQQLQEELHAA